MIITKMHKWLLVLTLLSATALLSTLSPVMAQTFLGPNAGFIQNGMMWPGTNRYGRAPSMFYGPVTAEEAGLPPKGYEKPVIIQDGVISGQILNPTRKARPVEQQP